MLTLFYVIAVADRKPPDVRIPINFLSEIR